MVRDAEAHADEDKKRRELVEARNQLDSLVYSTEKALREHKEKLGAPEREELDEALAEARKAIEGEDADAIERARTPLTRPRTSSPRRCTADRGRRIRPGASPGRVVDRTPAAGTSGAGKASDVIDAEFVDVDSKGN